MSQNNVELLRRLVKLRELTARITEKWVARITTQQQELEVEIATLEAASKETRWALLEEEEAAQWEAVEEATQETRWESSIMDAQIPCKTIPISILGNHIIDRNNSTSPFSICHDDSG